MLWHPSLPASTASETLPGNPGGGSGGSPWAPRSPRSVSVAMSAVVDSVVVVSSLAADGLDSPRSPSATSAVQDDDEHSRPPSASSPLQDAPGMPQPPPPPPSAPRGLRWRRSPWRSAGGGRRRRGAGQRGGRQSWVGRGKGAEGMPGEQWTPSSKGPSSPPPAQTSSASSSSSPPGERRGRSGSVKKADPVEDSMASSPEAEPGCESAPIDEVEEERMEITRVEKEEDKSDSEKAAGDEGGAKEEAEIPKGEASESMEQQAIKEEAQEVEEEKRPHQEEQQEERGGPVTRQRKEDAVAAKPAVAAAAEPESNLIGAKKRKSNKVIKREVEPRVEVVTEMVEEVIPEPAQPAEPKEEEETTVAEVEPDLSAPAAAEVEEAVEEPVVQMEEDKKVDVKAPKGDDEEDMRYVCPICEDVLSSQHLFTVHIRSHNTPGQTSSDGSASSAANASTSNGLKAFSCRICGKALSSSSSLDRHMLVHSGERPFKCRLCGVAFTTNGNMHRHMRTHAANPQSSKEPEEVSDCGSSDSGGSKRGKVTPKKSPAPPPTTTPSPGGGRKRAANGSAVDATSGRLSNRGGCSPRTRTAKEASEMGWRCLSCDISFRNQRALRVHAYMAHRELEPEEEEEEDDYDDDDCEEDRCLARKRTRRSGEREDRGQPNQTPTLGFQDLTFVDFSTQKFPLIANAACERAVHRASSEFHRFQCGRCDRAFPCGSALHIHADTRHRASSTSPATAAPPTADDPKEDFFAVLNLQNKTRQCGTSPTPANNQSSTPLPHVRLFPHSNSPSLSHLPYAERKRREEEFDNAFYFNSPAMKPKDLHLGIKKASKGMETDSVRDATDTPKDLADIHSIISAVAGNGSEFMRPMEEEEDDEIEGGGYEEEEEEQEEEDAAFAAELREMKMRGEFPCKLCPSVFPNLRALKGHCRNHIAEMVEGQPDEDEGENRYACCLCGRRIASDKHGLMRHLRSHNGERPFRCALCRYAFTTKANCERHLRNRHSKVSREEVRRSVIYSPVADESVGAFSGGDNLRDLADKAVNPRQESAFASSSIQCTPPRMPSPPTKLSALLTAISEAKSCLSRSEQFNKDHDKDEKPKFGDKDMEMRINNKHGGHMDDLSSVEALVNFAKSPSLPAPLTMVSGQLTLPLHQHLYRPIAVKQEVVKETVTVGAEAPLDLSMDALDLSSKKVQDEPEDLSRPSVGKLRTNLHIPAPSSVGSFNGGLLMPARFPSVPPTRPMAPPPTTNRSRLSPPMMKVDPTSVSISNCVPKMDIPMSTPPSQPPFYSNSLHMYLNSQYPTGASTPTRQPVGNFPYLLPLPFPSSGAPLITQLQPTQVQSPSLHPSPLISPSVTQSLSSQTVPSYPGIPASCAPPSMERLEKEILRNLQLSSGGSLVLDPAAMNEQIQALAIAAATAVGFPSAATTSEVPPKPILTQTKESKPNDPVGTTIREATPSKEDNRMQSGVKMVIKNGVLMPKQKQRRYRTERPFACCHCSARFTLRSNMERHIKQQHPEFWSQRPRGGRRGGSGGLSGVPSSRTDTSPSASDARLSHSPDGPLPPAASLPAESAGNPGSENGSEDYRDDEMNTDDVDGSEMLSPNDDRVSTPQSSTNIDDPSNKAKDNNNKKVISEEVKNAIAQQLKSKLVADCRTNSNSLEEVDSKRIDTKDNVRNPNKDVKAKGAAEDEDSGELVIDEEKMDAENNSNADKGKSALCSETKEDESSGVDLASVSKLLDNASTQTFQQYFRSEEDEEMEETEGRGSRRGVDEGYEGGEDGEDEEEEEGWKSGDETGGSKCASSGEEGSLRGANRGRADDRDDSLERKLANVTVEAATAADTEDKGKRRSAYSSAPNRVSCPYCMRKFPWRSSLRRHILTHTGQKPYKCAHCPLLFTTKSNCDRHLLRKHGRGNGGGSGGSGGCGGSSSGAEDSASVVSSSGGGGLSPGGSAASSAYTMRNVPERPYKCSVCPSSTFSTQNNLKKHLATKHHHLQPPTSGHHSGRLSASPRGGSEKGGSLSSASSPRCATEERDVDDEEDEEGLVGAEDEEEMLDEEEDPEEEEEEGEFEEDEESADCSVGDVVCNGEAHSLRSQSNSIKKKDPVPPQPIPKTQEKAPEQLFSPNQNKHQHLNGNLPVASADEGEQLKPAWDKGRTPPLVIPVLPSHPVQLPTHHQQQQHHHHHHHHHHPGSDLPFKCHLCERSYAERNDALNHIKDAHTSEYELLVAKGALDSANTVSSEDAHNNNHHNGPNNNNNVAGADQAGGEESLEQLRGKFPDYANRKVVCAFCIRRFWSAEDLRRHMRTHTGERPFSCDICARRFTLKHSMLRHRKKHSNAERNAAGGNNPIVVATSEASDEEAITTRHRAMAGDLVAISHLKWEKNVHGGKDDDEAEGKRRKLIPQELNLAAAIGGAAGAGDLIEKLLDIKDKSIIEKMLNSKSADDAAKLLGVDGHD